MSAACAAAAPEAKTAAQTTPRILLLMPFVLPRAVDEHEGDACGLLRAVGPCMVDAALDQHVARAQQRLALVHHRPDLAFEHDRVVDRLRAVHSGVLPRAVVVQ